MILKNNKGMSLVTMVMTVLIMLILLSTLTYTAYTNLKIRGLNKLYNDIKTLNDKVAVYYLENGKLPVSGEYKTISVGDELDETIDFVTKNGAFTNQDSLINPNDYNDESGIGQAKYYTIDLGLFDNISLENDGEYIINEQSHMIFYVDGVSVNGEKYYTLPLNYKDTEYNVKHPVNSVTVKNIYLPMGGVSVNLEDYMTFKASDGNVAVPKSITYSITTSGYENYFSLNNGVITSKNGIDATTATYKITATISSYGVTTTKTATLTVYLTDIKLFDSSVTNEINVLNLVKDSSLTIYTKKFGNAGTLRLLSKVENGNGIDASISNTIDSAISAYPITIKATNTGKVYLTIIENNGKATKEIEVNVFDPKLNLSSMNFVSLNDTKDLTLTIGDEYDKEPDKFKINWSSSDENIATVVQKSDNPLKSTINPTGFGAAVIYCEILVNDEVLTTLECNIKVTGVSIEDASLMVNEKVSPNYTIDTNIPSSSISDISIISSNTTVLEIIEDETTGEFEFSGIKAGTSTVKITVTLTGGSTYTDTCTVTVSE